MAVAQELQELRLFLWPEWGICLSVFWDMVHVVERTGGAGEARPPALLWLIQLLQEPPSLQVAAPKKNLHLWESLSPFKDGVPSEIIHPSIIHQHLAVRDPPSHQEPPLLLRASSSQKTSLLWTVSILPTASIPQKASPPPRTCIPLKASAFQEPLFPLRASSPLKTSIL